MRVNTAKCILLATLIFASVAPCQEDYGIRPIDRLYQAWSGPGYYACHEGRMLYLLNRQSVVVFDLSDTDHPQYHGTSVLNIDWCRQIVVQHSIAYITCEYGLAVYDLQNPELPVHLGDIEFNSGLHALSIENDCIYASSPNNSLVIYDIRNPEQIESIGSIQTDFFMTHLRYDSERGLLFGSGAGFQAFDVTDADNIERVLDFDYQVNHFTTDGEYVYLATVEDGLRIVEISEQGHNREIGHLNLEKAEHVEKGGQYVYVSYDTDYMSPFPGDYIDFYSMIKIDVSDPSFPVAQGSNVSSFEHFRALDLIDSIFIHTSDVLRITKLNDRCEDIAYFPPEGAKSMCSVDNDLFAVTRPQNTGHFFLTHFNIAAPENISEFSSLELEGLNDHFRDWQIVVSRPQVFLLPSPDKELRVAGWDARHDLALTNIRYQLPEIYNYYNFKTQGDYLFMHYTGEQGSGLVSLNKNLQNRPELNFFPFNNEYRDYCLTENYAYICAHRDGVFVLDISDPENPQEVYQFETDQNAITADANDNVLCITDGNLNIYDLTDPERPMLLACVEFDNPVYHPDIVDNFVFLRQDVHVQNNPYGRNILVYDITDPEHPIPKGGCATVGWPQHFFLQDQYLITSEINQMVVYDCSEAFGLSVPFEKTGISSSFVLNPAYPNPFNSMTTVSFTTPRSGLIKAGLYSLQGRSVMDVSPPGRIDPGYHKLVVNAGDLPAGCYFLKVEAGGYSRTTSAVYLK